MPFRIKFVRGDMYVVDKSKTLGHTATVTGVQWHPFERDVVLTSSEDCSVRLWNLNGKTQFQMLVCEKVFQPKSNKGQRTSVQCLAFHPGGREFAVGTSCGSIQIWKAARESGSRPDRAVYDAHGGGGKSLDAIVYSPDGSRLSSRSIDDQHTLIWDASKLSKSSSPVVRCNNTSTLFAAQCRPAFSPDGSLLCVGISELVEAVSSEGDKSIETGRVKFFQLPRKQSLPSLSTSSSSDKTSTLEAILELPISLDGAGVTDVLWHSKTNQLFLGCSDGKVEILFDQDFSDRGALLPFARAGRQKEKLSELLKSRAPVGSAALAARSQIIAPNSVPHKRKRDKDQDDPSETLKPQAPGAKFRMGRLNS
jgi:WD repeat-containing protein 70